MWEEMRLGWDIGLSWGVTYRDSEKLKLIL